MKSTFALIALIGAVSAGPLGSVRDMRYGGKLADDPGFLQFCSKYNKNMSDSRSFSRKQRRYHLNDTNIADHNRQHAHDADPNTLVLAHNWTSDLEPEEYMKMLGRRGAEPNNGRNTLRDDRAEQANLRGRGLQTIDVATTVDHFAKGYVGPVKDQGSCGSCWSFAAVTSFEGTIAKRDDTTPVRLSEQSLVDCTLTTDGDNEERFGKDYGMWGCQGGLLPPAWQFIIDNGIMTNADYPYVSKDSAVEGKCQQQKNDPRVIADRPKSIHMYTPNNTVTEMKAIWMQQPVSVSLDASRIAFQFYKSGVIKADADCGEQLNHAIVGVGYTDEGVNPDPNPNPNPGPDPTPPTPPTPTGNCTVKKWWHTCEDEPARRNLQDASGFTNYWLMQNQWGTGWGDNGFVRIEISGGKGGCGMNKELEWAEI